MGRWGVQGWWRSGGLVSGGLGVEGLKGVGGWGSKVVGSRGQGGQNGVKG